MTKVINSKPSCNRVFGVTRIRTNMGGKFVRVAAQTSRARLSFLFAPVDPFRKRNTMLVKEETREELEKG